MEDMIKQIIEIDKKAFKKKEDTKNIIKENEKRLKEKYLLLEKEIIQKTKLKAERRYKEEIEKCNIIVDNINNKGENEIKLLQDKFDKIHKKLSDSVFNEIFKDF